MPEGPRRPLLRPPLAADARFASNADRVRHRAVLVPLLAERLPARPRADGLAAPEAAQVPRGPTNSLDDVFDDAQAIARGMTTTSARPRNDTVQFVASPLMSATPVQLTRPPPLPEQHTGEVLGELGVDTAARQRLRALRVI